MKDIWKKAYPYLRLWTLVARKIWLPALFLFLGFFLFIGLEQGRDILKAFRNNEVPISHSFSLLIAVSWWGLVTWLSARVTLHASSLSLRAAIPSGPDAATTDPETAEWQTKVIESLQKRLPRLLVLVPGLITGLGLLLAGGGIGSIVLCCLVPTALLVGYTWFRRAIYAKFFDPENDGPFASWGWIQPRPLALRIERYSLKQLWAAHRRWILVGAIGFSTVLCSLTIWPVGAGHFYGAIALAVFALGGWLFMGTGLIVLEKSVGLPFTLLLLAYVLLIQPFNTNNDIRRWTNAAGETDRIMRPDSVHHHFAEWLDKRSAEWKQPDKALPVVLVAGEGGGLRAAWWTGAVLAGLQTIDPAFARHCYAISSVSGSSLGAATFDAALRSDPNRVQPQVEEMLSRDFLSPVIGAFTHQAILQRLLPFRVPGWDRARALEYSWEHRWAKVDSGSNDFSAPFDAMWAGEDRLETPALYLNSTVVETGKRGIFAPHAYDPEVIHGLPLTTLVADRVPLSTAVLTSARFPIITPPGFVCDDCGHNGTGSISLVDGGYYENSGVKTMLELYMALRPVADAFEARQQVSDSIPGQKVRFHLLFIQNSAEVSGERIQRMYEVRAPLSAFLNAWNELGIAFADLADRVVRNGDAGDRCMQIQLNRKGDVVPLNWVLSREAILIMRKQLKEMMTPSGRVLDEVDEANIRSFAAVLQALKQE